MRWWVVLFSVAALSAAADSGSACEAGGTARLGRVCDDSSGGFRVERRSVATGAELLTVFAPLPGADDAEIPLISVLRDTLGDGEPENDRLRYLWVLTSASPTL